MTERFDFSFWPPKPIERAFIAPAQPAPSEELCRDLLYIPNVERHSAVHATGEWADIEDFWIETLREPEPRNIRAESNLNESGVENYLRVHGRTHLQNATYTFHRMAYEVAAMAEVAPEDEHPLIKTLDEHGIGDRYQGDTRQEGFLFHHVFSNWDRRFSNRNILIARRAIMDVYDGLDPTPLGLGEDGRLILSKVALRWHENFQPTHFNT